MTQLTPIDWSEEILQEIFRNTSVGFVLIDLHGTIIEINEAFASMISRPREQILGQKMSQFVLEDDRDLTDTLLARLCSGEIGSYDVQRRYRRTGARPLTTKVTASVIRARDREAICAVELIEDIEARLQAEEALRESELRYRKVVEGQTDFIVRWLPNGTRIFVNDAYCRYFGQPREKILGTSFFPLIAKEDRAAVRKRIASLTPDQPVSTDQHRVFLTSGEVRWHEWNDRAFFDDSGEIVELQSVGRDITEQKTAEDSLVESEKRFRRLFHDLPIAVWEADWSEIVAHVKAAGYQTVEDVYKLGDRLVSEFGYLLSLSRILEANPVALQLAGVSDLQEFATWNRTAYPPEVIGVVIESASTMILGGADSVELEIPLISAGGERIETLVRWARSGSAEDPWRIIITVQDLTERKGAERALSASESKFRRFFQDLPLAAWLSDWSVVVEELRERGIDSPEMLRQAFVETPEDFATVGSRTRILDVNPVALELVGAESMAEFESWFPRHGPEAARRIVETSIPLLFENADTASCEVPAVTLDGESRQILLQWARTGSDAERWVFVVTALDLTEQKAAEQALRASELKYRSLFDELPIAVWMSDWAGALPVFEQLGIRSTEEFVEFAETHPKPERGSSKILELNAAAREFFQVGSTEEFQEFFTRALTEDGWHNLARAAGPLIFDGEHGATVELTLEREDGSIIEILTRWGRTEPRDSSWSFIVSAIDVTERKRAELALRDSELRYRSLFNELPLAVWLADWKIIVEKLTELGVESSDEMFDLARGEGFADLVEIGAAARLIEINSVGKTLFEVGEHVDSHVPIGKMLTEESWRRVIRAASPMIFDGADSSSVELTCERADGSTFDILTRWARTQARDSSWRFIVTAVDMTERNRIEKDLDAQRRLLEQAEAIARLGSWEWDAGSDTIRGSAEYSRILGRPEIESWTFDEFMERVHRDDLQKVLSTLSSSSGDGIGEPLEFRIVTPDGVVKHVRSRGYLLRDENGELSGGFGMLQDISRQKEAERIADRQREELIRADKMISLGILVSGVAHEINNPNHFIMLNAPFLRDVWRDAGPALESWAGKNQSFELAGLDWEEIRNEVPEILDEIQQGTERIRAIVSELKNFAKDPEHGMASDVSINDVVRAATRLISKRVSSATSNFEVRYREDVPRIRANPQKLEQVVINLVLNACDALDRNDASIVVETDASARGDSVCITVEDEGKGIEDENLKRILDPFFTTKRTEGGTGLGLAVSHRIVEEHGGELRFESNVGKGTRASVILPTAADERTQEN